MTTTPKGQRAQDPNPTPATAPATPLERGRALSARPCGEALDALDKADTLGAFLAWVASARELDHDARALRRAGTLEAGMLPATMDFDSVVGDGLQWVYQHLTATLAEARHALQPDTPD